ncbi:hypothetical protein ACFL54_00250 [Planctomycetota bacterium]
MNNSFNDPRTAIPEPRSGIVLLVVLGVLALLSVLAITFVSMTRLERTISQNYVDQVRAQLAAESGIEKAISELNTIIGTPAIADIKRMTYGLDQTGNPGWQDVTHPSFPIDIDSDGNLDAISGAIGSSYMPNGDRYLLKVEDESAKFNLNNTPGINTPLRMLNIVKNLTSNLFDDPAKALLITNAIFDTRSSLGGRFTDMNQVRKGLDEAGLLDPGDWQLLAKNLTIHSWTDPNTIKPNTQCTGRELNVADNNFDYSLHDSNGQIYLGTAEAKQYLDEICTVSEFQCQSFELEPRSPVHLNMVSQKLLAALIEGIQGYYIYEYGHDMETSDAFMHLKYYPPLSFFSSYSHGFNTSLDWFCDDAKMMSLKGEDPREDLFNNYSPISYTHQSSLDSLKRPIAATGLGALKRSIKIEKDLAWQIAEALYHRIHNGYDLDQNGTIAGPLEEMNPFRSWQEFKNYIYGYFDYQSLTSRYPTEDGDDLLISNYARQSVADAILANFNPNSDMIDYNPNKTLFKHVDKAHLLNDLENGNVGYTVEFCLEPSGVFSVGSMGRVLDGNNQICAAAELDAVIELFTPYRQTSQAHFLGSESSNKLTSSEDFTRIFLPNNSAVASSGAGNNILGSIGNINGFTTEMYPEPIAVDKNENLQFNRLLEAKYGGYIMPATLQDIDVDTGMTQTFRASFSGGLCANIANSLGGGPFLNGKQYYSETINDIPPENPELIPEHSSNDRLLIPARLQQERKDADLAPLLPGNLYVDGAYSEAHRTLIFKAGSWTENEPYPNGFPNLTSTGGNFGGNWGQQGILTMWIKPNWHPERTGKPHTFFDISSDNRLPFGLPYNGFYYKKCPELERNFSQGLERAMFKIFMHPAHNCKAKPWNYLGTNMDPIAGEYYSYLPYQTIAFALWGKFMCHWMPWNSKYRSRNLWPPKHKYLTLASPTANYGHTDNPEVDPTPVNFNGHRWSFMGIMWDAQPEICMAMQINGYNVKIPDRFRVHNNAYIADYYNINLWRNNDPQINPGTIVEEMAKFVSDNYLYPTEIFSINRYHVLTYDNTMRFGAWARGTSNFVADSTFDEINIFADGYNPTNMGLATLTPFYNQGRYYHDDAEPATFISPEIDPFHVLKAFKNRRLQLRSVSWTVYWPDDELDGIPAKNLFDSEPNPLWQGDAEKETWQPITVDICHNDYWLYSDDDDDLKPAGFDDDNRTLTNPHGSKVLAYGQPLYLSGGDNIRYKIYFNEDLPDDEPMHEAPVLDDITLMFAYTAPKVLSWNWVK